MNMRTQVELLAPAGDMECLRFALGFGADACYLGAKSFGMRSSSANFTTEELQQAAAMAHSVGKKIYLTLNTLPSNEELPQLAETMRQARQAGVDAFIVADMGVMALAKQHAPEVELHMSTQTGVVNYATALELHRLGAKRVVLARELTLDEIRQIRDNTPPELELEVFVHGAMCMSVSGRCLLSNYLTGRDANRGRCAQACRWKYSLLEEKRPGQQFEIGEEEAGSYILNADDLCTVDFLDRILDAGATSLKIEGRAKSFYYVASTTVAYRSALDAALKAREQGRPYRCPEFALQEVTRTSHRPYSPGFYLGRDGATQSPRQSGYIREWQVVGMVETQQDGWLHCIQRGKFTLGESLELLLPTGQVEVLTPETIRNEEGAAITATPHTKMGFSIEAPPGVQVPAGSILRRRITEPV